MNLYTVTPRPSRMPQWAYFPIHPSSRLCIIITISEPLSQHGSLLRKFCLGHRWSLSGWGPPIQLAIAPTLLVMKLSYWTIAHGSYLFSLYILHYYKVNRCLARYSPRATTTNRPTNRVPTKPAWPGPYQPKMPSLGQILSFWGKKSFFLLEES